MVSRKALIIGAPDSNIPGVNTDIKNLKNYLKSPIGGYWYDHEITTLISPTTNEIRGQIQLLRIKDYSLVFFAGHGYHSNQRQRTILHINSKEELDSWELRVGSPKHTLILDCCRARQDERRIAKAAMESFDSAERKVPSPSECRKFFDKAISECDPGIVVMNSCSIGETAGENESQGGYYTYSLIDSAEEWSRRKLVAMNLSTEYATFSIQECHGGAASNVKMLSGGRQNPNFEGPRTDKKFPFSVVA